MKHKHYDLIVAWANGAKIEFWNPRHNCWEDSSTPQWTTTSAYRIKPEPKPDVVLYACCEPYKDSYGSIRLKPNTRANGLQFDSDNIMLTFDGETHALKDAQVLVKLAV